MAEVVGRIGFTADKRDVVFCPENVQAAECGQKYPWHLLRSGTLLRNFLTEFAPLRQQSGRATFIYRLYTTTDALDAWFAKNGKVEAA